MKPMTVKMMYSEVMRNVNEHSTMPMPVMIDPQSMGLRVPNFWSSFSPTRIVARIATR